MHYFNRLAFSLISASLILPLFSASNQQHPIPSLTAATAKTRLTHSLPKINSKIRGLKAQMKMLLTLNQAGQLTPTAEYQIAAQINRLIKDIWHYLKPAQVAAKQLHQPLQKALSAVEYTLRRISYLTLTATKAHPQMSVKTQRGQKTTPVAPLTQLAQINQAYLIRLPELELT
ncbi:MAG TPA: hypothetical protein VJJ83_01340 [Candidatus Babeliales bacterium]|nr:hypothetical protein [Candidatus Babeliales bacterium]